MECELTNNEVFLIFTLRHFEFLCVDKNYIVCEVVLNTREEQWISFYSYQKKQTVIIKELEDGNLDFRIKKEGILSREVSIYDNWDKSYKIQSIERLAKIVINTPEIMKKI